MKTMYVLVMILLACATLILGTMIFVKTGHALLLIQAAFNVMLAAGALLKYRES